MKREPGIPERLGHFRVIEKLGEGGMGTVYVGADDTLDRRVALKIIRAEQRLDPTRKARFLREATILARLNHPGICQLHDFIEGDDGDVLVLELVNGRNLRQVMNDGDWTHADKLGLARQLLDVLVTVHSQGIIHRDVTPFNIMWTTAGRIKVLDFGLARTGDQAGAKADPAPDGAEPAVPEDVPEALSVAGPGTRHGAVIGTAAYMSPEQARAEPATAASDIFSAGLVLRELFTGRHPYGDDSTPDELQRRAMWGETLPLDDLPQDLTVLLNRMTELVPAARPSSLDAARMLKAIIDRPKRRRRRLLVASVWSVLALFGAGMTVQFLRAERAGERAEQQAARAEAEATAARQVSDFLIELFRVSDPGTGGSDKVTARQLLDAGAERIDLELADQPLLHARMTQTMGIVYHHLGDHDRAVELLTAALEQREAELGPDHPALAETLYELGLVQRYRSEYDEALQLMRRGLAIREADRGVDAVETGNFHHQIGLLEAYLGDMDAADERLRRSLEIFEAGGEQTLEETASTLADLAGLEVDRGESAAAEANYRRALEIRRRLDPDSLDTAGIMTSFGFLLSATDRPEEAEPLLRTALEITADRLGPDHPFTANSLNGLAHFFFTQKRYSEAEKCLRRALEIYRTVHGSDHPNTATELNNLGILLNRQGKIEEGAELVAEALSIYRAKLGDNNPDVFFTTRELARMRHQQGRLAESETLYRRALAVQEKVMGPENPRLAKTLRGLADCLRDAGRPEEADNLNERAQRLAE